MKVSFVARSLGAWLLSAAATVGASCAPTIAYEPGRVTRGDADGRPSTALASVLLAETWDGSIALELTASTGSSTVGATFTRRGAAARFDACGGVGVTDGERVLWATGDVAYSDDLENGRNFLESVTVPMPSRVLAELADSTVPGVVVCGDEFPLQAAHAQYLHEFLAVAAAP